MFNKFYKIIVLISMLFLSNILIAQDEAFHGGQGDGFSANTSGIFNLSNVPFEGNDLNVTVNQSAGQADPTDLGPVSFTVVFSEAVTDFDASDLSITGTANPQTVNITGSGTTYTILLSDISANGNIIVDIPAGGVHNSVGNPNLSSTSTDNLVVFTGLDLSVEVDLAVGQANLSSASEVHFSVVFSESVSDFSNSDVALSGTASASTIVVTGSGTTYDIAVSGMSNDGTVIISIPSNSAHNSVGSGNQASVNTQNTINCDFTRPSVEITLPAGQANPSPSPSLEFLATFSETIDNLQASDIQLSGTAGATNVGISQNGNIYTVTISGMTQEGTVIIIINENAVADIAGNGNTASVNTQNQITYSDVLFYAEIKQAATQNDPTNQDVAVFDIVFNREPADFDKSDVSITGNNSAGTINLTGSGTDYQLSLSDFLHDGTVVINLLANKVHDLFNNTNNASTNTDNQIAIDTEGPNVEIVLATGQTTPSNNALLVFKAIFSEDIAGFAASDVELSGSAGANSTAISGSGNEYFIEVSGMDANGYVVVSIPANTCADVAGNSNYNSDNSANTILYDISRPSVEITQAEGQEDPTITLPLKFNLQFSEEIEGFSASKLSFGGSAGVYLEVTGSGTLYEVSVNGVQSQETITINLPEGMVTDVAGNYNFASTNTDNSITYTGTSTGIAELEHADGCLIGYNNNQLHVDFERIPEKNSELIVYSIDGRLLFKENHLNQKNSYSLTTKNLIVIAKVKNGDRYSKSLIIID